MTKQTVMGGIVSLLLIFSLTSCAHIQATEAEKMLTLGAALRNLCSALEDTVKYETLPKSISDTELLARATSHDPRLLASFEDYALKPLIQDNSAILLVCSKDRKIGLLEDACCSYPLDKHLWEEYPPNPCQITLEIRQACPPK